MRVTTVYPQNNSINTAGQRYLQRNIPRCRCSNCTLTKKYRRILGIIILAVLVLICAAAVISAIMGNKNLSQTTPVDSTSTQPEPVNPSLLPEHVDITGSSISSDDMEDAPTTDISAPSANILPVTKSVGSVGNQQKLFKMNAEVINNDVQTKTFSADRSSIITNLKLNPWNHKALVNMSTIEIKKSTSSSNSTTERKPVRSIISLNHMNDIIVGLYNTTAGRSTGGLNGQYGNGHMLPKYAMDNSTFTKYFNYGHKGGFNKKVDNAGAGTGFLVIPSISNSTLACGLIFATGNDRSDRDPITVTLEGSNASAMESLHNGASWTLIYNGSTGIDTVNDPGRLKYGAQQNFSNTIHFSSYRLLISSQRNFSDAVQYSEARIMGYV